MISQKIYRQVIQKFGEFFAAELRNLNLSEYFEEDYLYEHLELVYLDQHRHSNPVAGAWTARDTILYSWMKHLAQETLNDDEGQVASLVGATISRNLIRMSACFPIMECTELLKSLPLIQRGYGYTWYGFDLSNSDVASLTENLLGNRSFRVHSPTLADIIVTSRESVLQQVDLCKYFTEMPVMYLHRSTSNWVRLTEFNFKTEVL